MKLIACLCALLLTLGTDGLAQTSQKPMPVIWSADTACHPNNLPEVKAHNPECSSVTVDFMTFYIIRYQGVVYAMSHRPVRDFVVASVQISNKTNDALQFSPRRSRMVRFKAVENYLSGVKGEMSDAETQDDLRQATYREQTVVGEADGGIRSGLRVQERYEEIRNRSGRVVSRTTINEPAAPPTSEATPSVITNSVLVPRAVFDNVLKTRTLAAGEKAAGHLVFKQPSENEKYIVFYLNVGQIEFVFPAQLK